MNKQDIVNLIIGKTDESERSKLDKSDLEKYIEENYTGINVHQLIVDYMVKHKLTNSVVKYLKSRENHLLTDAETLIKRYKSDDNASSSSKYDSNANVVNKNIATLNGELSKGLNIALNRKRTTDKITQLYGKDASDLYLYLLYNHFIYKNDETNIANYCASITMYPWLLYGLKPLGANSSAPKHIESFVGGFSNLVFAVSSQLSGAVATPEFLMYMSYFIEKAYGDNYTERVDEVVDLSNDKRTLGKIINDYFEHVVYSINEPTGARNYQAVFWNISYYDKYYFEGIFSDFRFPDGKIPIWENLSWLQKRFMKWFNKERTKTILTFPVETMALLVDENNEPKDKEWAEFTAEMYSEGHSFFTYVSDNPESLSSCCRLRNQITTNEFSYTLGAGGVSTGSKSVLTVNLNRTIQEYLRDYPDDAPKSLKDKIEFIKPKFEQLIDYMHKFQIAYNENLRELYDANLLPLFSAKFIAMNRQYLTLGINGLVESAEFLGLDITPNDDYQFYVESLLSIIEEKNKQYRTKELMFNCEMIPAENVGVKHARWDREDGYMVQRDCYNSYFYKSEDDSLTIIDKFKLHGREFIKHLTGGSANHVNLDSHLSKDQYYKIIEIAARYGCNYFTFNIPNTVCKDCGTIDKRYLKKCPKCGSTNVNYLTRIIGYLRLISNFSKERQEEAKKRHYTNMLTK